jgi:hypothetical protein
MLGDTVWLDNARHFSTPHVIVRVVKRPRAIENILVESLQ